MGGWGTQLRPCLMGFRCGQDGRLHHRRGLCAAMAACQAGGDRDDSLPKDWRYWGRGGTLPLRKGQAGEALFILEQTPLAQICPWSIHSSPLSGPPHPGAWCPIHDLRGGKRPLVLARGVAGNVAAGWVAPGWPHVARQCRKRVESWLTLPSRPREPPGPGGPNLVVNRPQDPGWQASGSGWGQGSLAGPWVASKFRNLITEWPRK